MTIELYDPIISMRRTGVNPEITENKIISNCVTILSEIPNKVNHVDVTGTINGTGYTFYETPLGSTPSIDTTNYYVYFSVDYVGCQVNFPVELNNTTLTFHYFGQGAHFIPSSRIITEFTNLGNNTYSIEETLQDLIEDTTALEVKGAWDATVTYEPNNIVTNGGFSYICTQTSLNQTPSSNPTYWIRMSNLSQLEHLGVWSSATAYLINNMVSYNSSSYICVADNTNEQPNTATTYWKLVALCGSVKGVTSANADISVATGTTTPVLTLNSGGTANQIVKRDSNAYIPTDSILFGGHIKFSWNAGLGTVDITSV